MIGMKVFITGSSSCVAKVLLPELCANPSIFRVTGIDIKESEFSHSKYRHIVMDIRHSELVNVMKAHDAVIHLAFAVKWEQRTLAKMKDINVHGGTLVVDAALVNNIEKFINLSSASVYGFGEMLTEKDDIKPSKTFYYAQHKALLESYIRGKISTAIQLRSHLIIGSCAQPFLKKMFKLPVWLRFNKKNIPRQQVIHEKDVVSAIMSSLFSNVSGTYNLAAPEIIALGGNYIKASRSVVGIPFLWVRYLAKIAQIFSPQNEYTLVEMLGTSLTVNCDKAKCDLN